MEYAAGFMVRLMLATSVVCMLLLLWPSRAQAKEAAVPQTGDLMVEAMVTGVNPATGRDDSTFAVRAYVGAERTRIDLHMPEADNAYMIVDNDSGNGWVISKDSDAALPIHTDSYRGLVVDPQAPCAHMRVSCQPLGRRDIAGVRAQGLRYSGARGRGPGASDRGEMWIDPSSGLVVGYEARTRDRKSRRMRATDVRREPLPTALFELPAALQPR